MTIAGRSDPLPGFNFAVQLLEPGGQSRVVAGFSECSGLDATLEIQEYQEGGVNDRVHKFPARFTFGTISLRRGISVDSTLRDWYQSLLRGETARRDGLIILLNEAREPLLAWRFEGGLLVKYSGPQLNAATSELATEVAEISHERLEPVRV